MAAEPEAAAELVAFCDHLPLAIRITGALLADQPTKSIAEHAAELGNGDRLDALAIDGDERACVRAAFAQSYRQLATDQSGLFRLLGLVPGPDFTPEATACLANLTLEQAEILLGQLAEIHLVERVSHHRYAFHDLLQEYSVQCGAAEDKPARRATAIRRLYDFYLGRTDAASRRLHPGILRLPMPRRAEPDLDGPTAQSWLDNERANIVAAVIRAADDGLGPAAWLLADAIRGHFYIDRYTVDWIRVAEAALGIAVSHGDIMAQVAGHISLGMAHNHLNRSGMAITHQLVALALAQQSEWLDAESALLNNLGDTYLKLGRLEDAHRALDHATQVLQRIDAPARQAITDSNLGMAEHLLGGSGLRHLTDALTLHRSVGNVNGEADVHRKIGTVHLDNGNPSLAAEHAQAALALIGSSPGRMFESDSLNLLGAAKLATGSPHEAIDSHQRALRLATDVDDRYGIAEALLGLAATELSRSCPDPTHAERALSIARELGYRMLEGQALTALAELSTQLGDPRQGRKHARAALALQRKTKYRAGVKQARRALDHAIETARRD
ncbi:MAG TPA: hypothetical protein DGG94_07835 [Micromonosporaceae bacterium]|nr:hypothetical protein [Micromonosporaceae bacterium]